MLPVIPPQTPRLPDPGPEYNRGYMDVFLSSLRLYFNRLSGAMNVLFGPFGASSLETPYALIMSDQDQTSAGTTSANAVTYNQIVLARGIEVRNNSEIWFEQPGQYRVTVELQVSNRDNAVHEIDVWVRENGTDYPLSNLKHDVPARKDASTWGHVVVSFSGIFTVADPSVQHMSIAWWSNGALVFLEHYPAGTNPTRPETPSAVVTISAVSRLPTMP